MSYFYPFRYYGSDNLLKFFSHPSGISTLEIELQIMYVGEYFRTNYILDLNEAYKWIQAERVSGGELKIIWFGVKKFCIL